MWEWAPGRITALARACVELGHHPESWKMAKGVVIPKPGKSDYTQVRAHLQGNIPPRQHQQAGRADGCTPDRGSPGAAQQAPRRAVRMPEAEFGGRCGRGVDEPDAAGKKVAGALLMDVKAALNNVSRPVLSRRMGELGSSRLATMDRLLHE